MRRCPVHDMPDCSPLLNGCSWQPDKTYYVLTCLICEPLLPVPFASAAERGSWAAAHTAGTGHDQWLVKDRKERG